MQGACVVVTHAWQSTCSSILVVVVGGCEVVVMRVQVMEAVGVCGEEGVREELRWRSG